MKRILSVLMILTLLLATGCETQETETQRIETQRISRYQRGNDEEGAREKVQNEEIVYTKIEKSTQYMGNNENTVVTNEKAGITRKDAQDVIILATDAKKSNGEMNWKNSNYWVLAVMVDDNGDGTFDGCYNLYYGDTEGQLSVDTRKNELDETIIVLEIAGEEKTETREYSFDGKYFVEKIV